MTLVIALTQFVFLSLGTLAVNILLKSQGYPIGGESYPVLEVWLKTNALWLYAIPAIWMTLALLTEKNAGLYRAIVQPLGVILTVALIVAYGAAILSPA